MGIIDNLKEKIKGINYQELKEFINSCCKRDQENSNTKDNQ